MSDYPDVNDDDPTPVDPVLPAAGAREMAQAARCQLLVGSYPGATRVCECWCPRDCPLAAARREALRDHPRVVAARARCRQEFESSPRNQPPTEDE